MCNTKGNKLTGVEPCSSNPSNPSKQKAEAGASQTQGQLYLQRDVISKSK